MLSRIYWLITKLTTRCAPIRPHWFFWLIVETPELLLLTRHFFFFIHSLAMKSRRRSSSLNGSMSSSSTYSPTPDRLPHSPNSSTYSSTTTTSLKSNSGRNPVRIVADAFVSCFTPPETKPSSSNFGDSDSFQAPSGMLTFFTPKWNKIFIRGLKIDEEAKEINIYYIYRKNTFFVLINLCDRFKISRVQLSFSVTEISVFFWTF